MKKIKIIRTFLILGYFAFFFWLYFMGASNIGMFHFLPNSEPIPETGISIISFKDGKSIEAYAIDQPRRGGPAILKIWPIALIYSFLGYPFGFISGEFFRKKFVHDTIQKEALDKIYAMRKTAENDKRYIKKKIEDAESSFLVGRRMELNAEFLEEETYRELSKQQEIRKKLESQLENLESQLQYIEKEHYRTLSLEKELQNARAKNKRLKNETSPSLGKII